ncbi:MAG: glycosyltransferase family 2 protein [Aequorivita sp.]
MNKPLVSISCVTFNHEPYIRQCLEGFMMQECNFEFEILIHDDASTDKTQDIISEYVLKYPNIIKPIFQTENQWSKTTGGMNAHFNFPRAEGKYIAICDGDDYWTDPLKLQKQVDYMKENEDCSLCYHKIRVKMADNSTEDYFFGVNVEEPTKFTLEDFIKTNNGMGIRTPAMMIRSQYVLTMPNWMMKSFIGDLVLQLYCGSHGQYGYLPEEMAVYNRGNPGAWSENNQSVEWRLKQIRDLNTAYSLFDKATNYKYHELIGRRNNNWIRSRVEYVQRNFNRSDQFKIIQKHFKTLIIPDRKNAIIWIRFFLGNKIFQKLIELKK